MCSELGVGHHRVGGGDTLTDIDRVPVGLLGADYSVDNNRYRFKKVYGGLNWNPELRFFQNSSGWLIQISVSTDPDGKNSRNKDPKSCLSRKDHLIKKSNSPSQRFISDFLCSGMFG
ncbi:MAG: hypothetical protein GF421_06960 [Candidatus Aminicenantes bacterium]|nr:hypothetical protein [Candidatus Aminicenantes bacterium]